MSRTFKVVIAIVIVAVALLTVTGTLATCGGADPSDPKVETVE